MKKVVQKIYWVYRSKKVDNCYARTLMTVVGLIFIHIVQIVLIFGIPANYLFPFELKEARYARWLNASLILTPLIIAFLVIFKKRDLELSSVSESDIERWKRAIPFYFLLSFLILIALLVREGVKRGTI